MHKHIILPMLLAVAAALLIISGVALGMSSANYRLDWATFEGNGGGPTDSANYGLGFTVGQTVIGSSSSTNYGIGLGYWYGAGGSYSIYLPLVLKNA